MLPTFDAPMMDYLTDIDVPMHSSNSESWYLGGDLAMEDDPGTPNPRKVVVGAERIIPTIEVDMEDWAPEPVEYEMIDEAEIPYDSGGPSDVEVYDVSQIASQIHSPSGLDAPQVLPDNITDHPRLSSPSFSPTIEVPMLPESDGNLRVVDEAHGIEPALETVGDPSYSVVVDLSQPSLTDNEASHPSTEVVPADEARDPTLHPATDDARAVDNEHHLSESSFNHTENSHHQGVIHNDENEAAINSPVQLPHTEHPVAWEGDHTAFIPNPEQVEEEYSRESNQEDVAHDHDQAGEVGHQSSADPHEISDGVYIDPPPAVLLSFSLADDEFELCLFNPPATESGASTPAAEHRSEQFKMLLHDKPTLYYEPLTSVFDALRQEPEIARIPDFTNGELVLHAYDLDLSISEVCICPRLSAMTVC